MTTENKTSKKLIYKNVIVKDDLRCYEYKYEIIDKSGNTKIITRFTTNKKSSKSHKYVPERDFEKVSNYIKKYFEDHKDEIVQYSSIIKILKSDIKKEFDIIITKNILMSFF